jgi:glycerol-3-phosphate dehydrogenase (NAD+)
MMRLFLLFTALWASLAAQVEHEAGESEGKPAGIIPLLLPLLLTGRPEAFQVLPRAPGVRTLGSVETAPRAETARVVALEGAEGEVAPRWRFRAQPPEVRSAEPRLADDDSEDEAVAALADACAQTGEDVPDEEWVVELSGQLVQASTLKVAVYGGGSFGTAMACVLGRKGIQATLVVRKEDVVEAINTEHRNPYYQSDLLLPSQVRATTDAAEAFRTADFIVHAVPLQATRKALEAVKPLIRPDVPILSLTKGIETSSLALMSDILPDVLGPQQPVAYLSGPSFAAEIVQGLATAVTVTSEDRLLAKDLMALFTDGRTFRALYSPDVIGVEVGGAVKNVIALAAGMSEGLGLGTNAMAALVTRGCSEMRRLVVALGGQSSTVFGLSGVGDTFGTCFGPLSRNRQVGYRLGQGERLEDILDSMSEVAEGVATARALRDLIDQRVKGYRKELKYPILYGVARIIDGEFTPREGLTDLMENYPNRMEELPF